MNMPVINCIISKPPRASLLSCAQGNIQFFRPSSFFFNRQNLVVKVNNTMTNDSIIMC